MIPTAIDTILAVDMMYVVANRIEAGLWIIIGAAFLVAAIRRQNQRRGLLILAFAFVAFGISDLVEIRYGQWWDPWWLLAWKGVCVLVFLIALIRYAGIRRCPKSANERNVASDVSAD